MAFIDYFDCLQRHSYRPRCKLTRIGAHTKKHARFRPPFTNSFSGTLTKQRGKKTLCIYDIFSFSNWNVSFGMSYFLKIVESSHCNEHVSFKPEHLNSQWFREILLRFDNKTEINFSISLHSTYLCRFSFVSNTK